jgi:hypothetical protein
MSDLEEINYKRMLRLSSSDPTPADEFFQAHFVPVDSQSLAVLARDRLSPTFFVSVTGTVSGYRRG